MYQQGLSIYETFSHLTNSKHIPDPHYIIIIEPIPAPIWSTVNVYF